jgi:ketosteroid isomerase-like protein
MQAWAESFDHLTIEATEIINAGDKVVVGIIQRDRPRGAQNVVEGRWWIVTTFREGNFARMKVLPERAQALEATGLRE